MKRRGFFRALAGVVGAGVAVKTLPKEESPKLPSPAEPFFGVDRTVPSKYLKGFRYEPSCLMNKSNFDKFTKGLREWKP